MPVLETIVHVWYYQTALLVMYIIASEVYKKYGETSSAAMYVFLAYVAVVWHSLIEQLFKQVR
jgi:hypothetical protein